MFLGLTSFTPEGKGAGGGQGDLTWLMGVFLFWGPTRIRQGRRLDETKTRKNPAQNNMDSNDLLSLSVDDTSDCDIFTYFHNKP